MSTPLPPEGYATAELVEAPAPVVVANQFQAALLGAVVTIVFALQTAMAGGFSQAEGWNLLALSAATVAIYIAPVLPSKWASVLKVGAAVLAAVAIAVIPLVDVGGPGWTVETTIGVAFAGLQALAAAVGVNQRVAENKALLADPVVDNSKVVAADPQGARAAAATLERVDG